MKTGAVVGFPDVHGHLRQQILHGPLTDVYFCRAAVANRYDGQPGGVPGYGASAGLPDMLAVPVSETHFTDGWGSGLPFHFADLHLADGSGREPLDSRRFLEQTSTALRRGGHMLRVGFELEFLLIDHDAARVPPSRPRNFYSPTASSRAIMAANDDLLSLADACGVAVEGSMNEFEHGQLELTFPPLSPLEACDNLTLARVAVHRIARRHGLTACLMPQPFSSGYGNGLHVNLSLDSVGGERPDVLIERGIARLLERLPRIVLIFCPGVNSYKRLGNAEFHNVRIAMGRGRRDALVRIVERPRGTHVELRFPDPLANPYLAIGVVSRLIAEGPDPSRSKSLLAEGQPSPSPRLPRTLSEAVAAFQEESGSGPITSGPIDTALIRLKESEAAALETAITAREWETYAGCPPPSHLD